MNSNKNDSLRWKVLESEYLHREPWLTVRKERLQLPNGTIVPKYYVLEYNDWVNIIAITKDGKYIMVEQYRHGIGETCMEVCAGVCESGEAPLDAAKRELLEETGYGNGEWTELICTAPNASANTNLTYTYIANGVEKIAEPTPEESEDLIIHHFSVDEVKNLLAEGKIIQATMVAPLWKYFALNNSTK